jgi:hypothetical protein
MAEVDDTIELTTPGVGDGDGVGVGVGEAVGVGVGDGDVDGDGDCASAADTAPTASASTIANRRTHARPAPNLRLREARDEQRIHFIPDKSARSKIAEKPVGV